MLTKSSVLIFILLSIDLALSFNVKPVVTTSCGRIQGFYRELLPGRAKYEAYQGIPYALPPIGKRRFSPPEPIKPWKDTLLANKLGSMCMQHRGYVQGDEDCLYLNVYAPLRRENQSLPVIVLIHGGSFQYLHGDWLLQPHYLVKEDVIVVGMNYRLGSLGFLSTEDEVVPGNMGLKDQSMALRWVQTHIQAFGGDPTKVTIVGGSAGGASVHYHYLSRMSAGLFQSGMSFSGTALDCWTQTENSREKAMRLAELVNCPTSDARKMIECMRQRPAQDIAAAQTKFMPWQGEPFAPFGPVIEKPSKNAFIDRPPIEIITSGNVNKAPWVTGVVSGDGLYPVAEFALKSEVLEELDKNWESIAPLLLDYNNTIPVAQHANVAHKIRQHYFDDKSINYENLDYLTHMVGDRIFIADAGKAAKEQAKANPGKIWFYYYSYRAATSICDLFSKSTIDFGVCHGDDYLLTIGNSYIDPVKRKNDLRVNKELIQFWFHVARTGVPKLGPEWTPVDGTATELNYLHVRGPGEYSMKTHLNFGQKNFWNSIDFNENKVA